MANRKITDMTALTAPASTDVLPIVDVSETTAADKNKKITVAELFKGIPDGTESAPSIAFESDDGNGIYLAGTDTVAISTGGAQRLSINASGVVSISGDLTVSGTTTTIESTTLTVDDKNIELGSVTTPSDTTADGGGITLKGATDKTINWVDSTDSWTFSEHVDLASGKSYRINNTEVLSATTLGSGVTASSLTSVGTLTALTVSGDINMTGTGAIEVAAGTSAQRDALTASNGMFRYNTDDAAFEGYADGAWGAIGGGGGASADGAIYEVVQTISSSYSITSGSNGLSAGPITIASGATVTVPSGSVWTIV